MAEEKPKKTRKSKKVDVRKRRNDIEYTEKATKKVITRVIAKLKGSKSAHLSKLARNYMRIVDEIEELEEAREAANLNIKDTMLQYFDATDAIYTRVIDTVSATLTLSKDPEATETFNKKKYRDALIPTTVGPQAPDYDIDAHIKALEEMSTLNADALAELRKGYIKLSDAGPPRLTLTSKLDEEDGEDFDMDTTDPDDILNNVYAINDVYDDLMRDYKASL